MYSRFVFEAIKCNQKDQIQPRLERNLWRFRGCFEIAISDCFYCFKGLRLAL